MSYRITGLNAAPFVHLYGLTDAALRELGVQRIVADARPGYPDRIEMRDAEVGEIPEAMRGRLLSLRAYDDKGQMLDADVVEGCDCGALIHRLFENPDAAYIHAHNAKRGCYSGRIDRA